MEKGEREILLKYQRLDFLTCENHSLKIASLLFVISLCSYQRKWAFNRS